MISAFKELSYEHSIVLRFRGKPLKFQINTNKNIFDSNADKFWAQPLSYETVHCIIVESLPPIETIRESSAIKRTAVT